MLLLLWRLSSSPIQLNQFVPKIEQAASNLPGGLSVRLSGIGLFLNRVDRHIDLRALNVELVESSGTSLVSAPEVNISLSIFALVRGVVALSSVELNDVDVELVRREDGTFQIFKKKKTAPVVGGDDKPRDFMETTQHLFKVLASEANTENPLSYLKNLKIKGSLEVEDRKNNLHWAAHAVESLFVGYKGVVKGSLGVNFSSPEALDGIHADIALELKDNDVSARLDFGGVRPAGFASFDPRLAALAGLDTSFGGTINTTLTLPDTFHSLTANIKGGAGQLSYQDYYPESLKLNSLELQLSADVAGKFLQVSSLDVLLGEVASPLKLHLNATAKMLDSAVAVKLETSLQQIKVNELDLYWPGGVAKGARAWLVTNLKAGTATGANLALDMLVPTTPETKFQLNELKGTVAYSDLEVTYFGSLPPATGVTGSGTFDQRGFDLDIDKGLVNGVNIESGKVVISGMDVKKAAISVETRLNGQLAAAFAVLEKPPISLSADSITGMVSDRLGGQVVADFSIALPLKAGLADEDVHYQARGKITDGRYSKIFRDYNLQAANIDFSMDQTQINLNGPLEFSGVPLALNWTTSLQGPDKGHADFTVNSTAITSAQISGLGYDVSKYMQGSITLKTTAKLAPGGSVTASIESDMDNAALTIPQIHWDKSAGGGGTIDFTLQIEKNHFHANDIKVELGELKTNGNAEIDITGSVMSVSLDHLALSYAQLNGLKLERKENNDLQFSLQGGEASLEPFLSGNSQAKDPQEKQVAVETKALARQLESRGIIFEVGVSKLDKVYVNKDIYFDNIQFSGRRDGQGWQEVKLSGHNPFASSTVNANVQSRATERLESGQFSFIFGPPENDRYPLRIEAEDFGSLVSSVKGKNVMKGGYLVLNGDSQGPFLTKPIQATLELDSFTIKDVPGIAKVLNMASLTQIVSSFMHTGLAFNSASGDLRLDGERFSSQQIRLKGGSLGVRASGWADLKQRNMDITGTVVPMSKINAIVGIVPVLGNDGKGIMAIDYTLKGPMAEPEVSIRKAPLTSGILKNTLGTDEKDTSNKQQ